MHWSVHQVFDTDTGTVLIRVLSRNRRRPIHTLGLDSPAARRSHRFSDREASMGSMLSSVFTSGAMGWCG